MYGVSKIIKKDITCTFSSMVSSWERPRGCESLESSPQAFGENSFPFGYYQNAPVSRPLFHTSWNSSLGWDGRGWQFQTRNRQEWIIFLGPVAFLMGTEARREKQRGDGSERPVAHANFLLGVRSCSGLCKHFYRKIVAVENPSTQNRAGKEGRPHARL